MTLAMKLKDERWAGREEGRAEGLEESRAEGREEGRLENQTETIQRMLAGGFSFDDICLASGLSLEEVKRLAGEDEIRNR